MLDILEKNQKNKILIAGPCVIQSWDTCYEIAIEVKRCAELYNFYPVFKASFDKANRTSYDGFRGIGIDKGLEILNNIKERLGIDIITDVHDVSQVNKVASVVDILQIPAFLCRQTDLIEACAKTGKPTLVKKGQFLSPEACKFIEDKFYKAGGSNLMIGERGNSFGYNTLVVDFRSLPQLQSFGCPVIFDATHSVQQPGGQGGTSGGQREYVSPLARAAVAVGVDGLFMEIHPNPDEAMSDGPNMLPLHRLEPLLKQLLAIRAPLLETGPMPSSF